MCFSMSILQVNGTEHPVTEIQRENMETASKVIMLEQYTLWSKIQPPLENFLLLRGRGTEDFEGSQGKGDNRS